MTREEIKTTATCRAVKKMDDFVSNPIKWLSEHMREHKLTYLLAHADDGVIWGRLDGEELITSHDIAPQYSPPLRAVTLQTARIFAPAGELLIWRNEDNEWAGRLIAEEMLADATARWDWAFEEQQILLGTKTEPQARDFTLMGEGSQGLSHVVPLKFSEPIDNERRHLLRLVVRHYWLEDEYGFTRVGASRLFDLRKLEESNI